MDRKQFILATAISTALISIKSKLSANILPQDLKSIKIPPFLNPGDTIGITSPASHISLEEIQPAVDKFREWGFEVNVGKTIGLQDFTFGGTDQERLEDLQKMLDDPNVTAIMCARGGYGLVRIIDSLNFDQFIRRPKWIIGFSDVTVLHCHVNTVLKIASIHAKMCNSFPSDWNWAEEMQKRSILSIREALTGKATSYKVPTTSVNRLGKAEGILVGGNLSIIESLAGSVSDLDTKGKILFVEDTGEYLYNIDRMFWNLARSGKLKHLKGLIIGGFKLKPDDPGEEFGKTVYEIVLEKVGSYNYPVLFDFPVGHQKDNVALSCGLLHRLEIGEDFGTLTLFKS